MPWQILSRLLGGAAAKKEAYLVDSKLKCRQHYCELRDILTRR
jgi:hypothetical protein